MNHEAGMVGFFTGFFLGLPLTLAYLAGLILSMMAKQRIGNAANFAIGGFAFFLVAQSVSSVIECVTWFLAPSAGQTSMLFISLIVKLLVCGFMQMVALGLLIAAFAKRVNAELPVAPAAASQVAPQTQTQTSVQMPAPTPGKTQTQTRVHKDSEAADRPTGDPDQEADPDTQTRTRLQR